VKFKGLVAVNILRDVRPCGLVQVKRRFGGTHCLYLQSILGLQVHVSPYPSILLHHAITEKTAMGSLNLTQGVSVEVNTSVSEGFGGSCVGVRVIPKFSNCQRSETYLYQALDTWLNNAVSSYFRFVKSEFIKIEGMETNYMLMEPHSTSGSFYLSTCRAVTACRLIHRALLVQKVGMLLTGVSITEICG
jgi:hypothetical protein